MRDMKNSCRARWISSWTRLRQRSPCWWWSTRTRSTSFAASCAATAMMSSSPTWPRWGRTQLGSSRPAQDFLDERGAAHRRVRGIGEPIWSGRSPAQLAECQRHEALLNLAFDDPSFWLLCPYDLVTLDATVIDEARRTHPIVRQVRGCGADPARAIQVLANWQRRTCPPLSEVPDEALVMAFRPRRLRRGQTVRRPSLPPTMGWGADRVADLVLAADEICTNSLRHGEGQGTVRIWTEGAEVVCEIRDRGRIQEPPGRSSALPSLEHSDGRGLWMVNQLCDLFQIRSTGGARRCVKAGCAGVASRDPNNGQGQDPSSARACHHLPVRARERPRNGLGGMRTFSDVLTAVVCTTRSERFRAGCSRSVLSAASSRRR